MDGLRQHLFASPGFAEQKDCRVGLRDLSDFIQYAPEARRLAYDAMRTA